MGGLLLYLCFLGIVQGLGNHLPPPTHKEELYPNDQLSQRKFELLISRVEELEARDQVNQNELQHMKNLVKSIEVKDAENQQKIVTLQNKVASLETKDAENENEVKILQRKVASLEINDAENQKEIRTLQSKMASLETVVNLNEHNILTQLFQLKSECEQAFEKSKELYSQASITSEDILSVKNERKDAEHEDGNGNTKVKKATVPITEYRKRRTEPEVEVAFYAYITTHDVLHLGVNQNIVFDNAVTNLGNAYHNLHGIFTAPVAGTYVFFVTISSESSTEGYAYVDVNGIRVANLILKTPYEQRSQTVIVQLKSGDDVSVKNIMLDEALLGDKFTTFAGFLLFQNYSSPSPVVG